MCRMFVLHAGSAAAPVEQLVASPFSLKTQSHGDAQGKSHRDGWGIAWYVNGVPQTARSVLPAYDDARFAEVARAAASTIVLGHVRDASVGTLNLENCHPFCYGNWTFCHNGTIHGLERLLPAIERETLPELRAARRGETDSERLFFWLLSNAAREGYAVSTTAETRPHERVDADGLYEFVRESLRRLLGWCAAVDVEPPSGLNVFLTDGRVLLASRYGRTLWYKSMPSSEAARADWHVASEPVDDLGPWREADDASILTIDGYGRFLARPL